MFIILVFAAVVMVSLFVGFMIGAHQTRYIVKQVNLSTRFTFDEILEFVGGNPQNKTILHGSKRTAILLTDTREYIDECIGNTIYYCGVFHTHNVSPAQPRHQRIDFSLNKHMNEYRGVIHIFVKIRSNEYALIGTGKRSGKYKKIVDRGSEVLIFPIRYMSGSLNTVMGLLTPPNSPRSPRSRSPRRRSVSPSSD